MNSKYKEFLDKSGEMYSTHGEKSYYAGYELAQKELQEKLKTEEEDIKEINHAEVKLSKFTPVEVITFNKESN